MLSHKYHIQRLTVSMSDFQITISHVYKSHNTSNFRVPNKANDYFLYVYKLSFLAKQNCKKVDNYWVIFHKFHLSSFFKKPKLNNDANNLKYISLLV